MVGTFGAMSILGNYSGVEILGGIANVRDLGAMIAGLLGDLIVGGATGLIGGAYRYSMGGFTAVPSSLATVVSGLFGGLVWIWKRKLIGVLWATSFANSDVAIQHVADIGDGSAFCQGALRCAGLATSDDYSERDRYGGLCVHR